MLLMQSWSSVSCADCSVHCGMFQWAIMARQNYQKPTLNCSDRSRFFISKPSGYWDWHDLCRGPPLPASRLSPRRNWFTRERAESDVSIMTEQGVETTSNRQTNRSTFRCTSISPLSLGLPSCPFCSLENTVGSKSMWTPMDTYVTLKFYIKYNKKIVFLSFFL